eukprot:c19852_g1_i1.p1 GENE.c19852_g1_i1~~c19852_g1_i1.p1  ORF type:complete len:337 (+),score=67.45 c19852_g1_i1:2-1012(+)
MQSTWGRMHLLSFALVVGGCLAAPHHLVATRNLEVPPCILPISLRAGDSCQLEWGSLRPFLRPTQPAVGYALVQQKFEKDFTSSDAAQRTMDKSPVPVVLGPHNNVYLVDHHHTVCALDLSTYRVNVTISVVCDLSDIQSIPVFWDVLRERNYALLVNRPEYDVTSLPRPINYTLVPSNIVFGPYGSSFTDDPWRSFANFLQKVTNDTCPKSNKYCQRGYYKSCDKSNMSIPFYEFRWGYFMTDALFHNTSLWDNNKDRSAFQQILPQLQMPATAGKVDVKPWIDATNFLVSLCRGWGAMNYVVPSEITSLSGILPGYVPLDQLVPADPDCDLPKC